MFSRLTLGLALLGVALGARVADAGEARSWAATGLEPREIFELEWVDAPRISTDGKRIIYLRRGFDIMRDRATSALWMVSSDGKTHVPLVTDVEGVQGIEWSPDGGRVVFSGKGSDGRTQLFVHWVDSRRTVSVTHVDVAPSEARWSPDGSSIALIMAVRNKVKPMVEMPAAPKGAKWAKPAKVIEQVVYRRDGTGYLEPGHEHLFVVPSDGGTPRQLTTGDFDHESPSWTPDGSTLLVSANRREDWASEPLNTEVHAVDVATGKITPLTQRDGPDGEPVVSPDGERVAYVGFDDRRQGYQVRRAYVMNIDGTKARLLSKDLDRSIRRLQWSDDGRRLYFLYDDRGNTKVGSIDLDGKVKTHTGDVGGTTLGRPYASGDFSVSHRGEIAFTRTRPEHPADLALVQRNGEVKTLVRLNADLLDHQRLASVEPMEAVAPDGRRIQGWIARPPGFDRSKKYPLILEIHGGPFTNYGDRFSAEVQLYAAAGFVVLYVNPRGSTSYGGEFGNLIHHAYPGEDYGDLMASVDALIAGGSIDTRRLFVTGGSGGGVLTAWIVGKTNRFAAAVVAKPVINWASFVLYADMSPLFTQYWFPGMPWEIPEHYQKRSPLAYVGNVETPTMLLTGEADLRTPIAESEQFYQALKLRKIDTALVRIPGASHGIAARPSQLIAKVLHVLAWFDRYDPARVADADRSDARAPSASTPTR